MKNQITLDGLPEKVKSDKNAIQKWESRLQRYCDKSAREQGDKNGYCVCGYMEYCDCCLGSGEINACVKAIVRYCKDNNISIDYEDFDFEKFLDRLGG